MRLVIAAMGLLMATTMVRAAGHAPCDIEGLPAQAEAKLATVTGPEADPLMDWCYRLSIAADRLRLTKLRGENTDAIESRLAGLMAEGFELVATSADSGRKSLILANMLQVQRGVMDSGWKPEPRDDKSGAPGSKVPAECEQILQQAREIIGELEAAAAFGAETVQAEQAEFSDAAVVDDEQASGGQALEIRDKSAQIRFRLKLPAGQSQFYLRVKGSGTSADSLFVQVDGGDEQSVAFKIGEFTNTGSFTIADETAREHEVLLTMRENPPIWVDYLAYTASARAVAEKAAPALAAAYLILRGALDQEQGHERVAELLLAAYAATVTTHQWHHYFTDDAFWYWQTQRLLAGVFEDMPELSERTRFRELAFTAVTQPYYLGRELPKDDAATAWDKVLALSEMGESMPLDEIIAANLAAADGSLRCQAALLRFVRLRAEEDAGFMEQMLGDFRPGVFYDDERLAQMWQRNTTDDYYLTRYDHYKKLLEAAEALMDQSPPTWQPAADLAHRAEVYEVPEYKQAGAFNSIWRAYITTGIAKYGPKAAEVWIDGSVRQWEVHAAYRCYYSSVVPWDQQYRTLGSVGTFDCLQPLMSREDKRRLFWQIREMVRELTVALAYLPAGGTQHNAHCRYCGAVGLAGHFYPMMPEAGYWRELANRFRPYIHAGILSDGGWLEQTTAYHMFAAWPMVLYYMAADKLQGEDYLAEELAGRRLGDMLDWMAKVVTPNGGMPRFNDGGQSDPGVQYYDLHQLAQWLGKREYAFATRNTRTPLLCPDYPGYEPKEPDFTSVLLPDSGIAVMRDSWEEEAYYAALDFGPHGGGHGHCDKGNFVLYAEGEAWVVDSRYGWRKTEDHNTIVVDGENQQQGRGTLLKWETDAAHDAVAIYHDLYPAVRHYRSLYHERGGPFVVVDRMVPNDEAEHSYTSRLYLLGETAPEGDCYLTARDGKGIVTRTGASQWSAGEVAAAEFSYASDPRKPQSFPVYVVRWDCRGAGEQWLVTVLVPYAGEEAQVGEVSLEPQGTVSIVSFALNGGEKRYAVPTPAAPRG